MRSQTLAALRGRVMTDRGEAGVSRETEVSSAQIPVGESIVPIDTAAAHGDGWQLGGEGEVVQSDLPSSKGGPGWALQTKRRKEEERLNVPCNFVEYPEMPLTANSGVIKDVEVGFPIHTMVVDNLSNVWVYLDGAQHYIPPGLVGIQIPVFAGPTKLRLTAAAPPGAVQPALSSPAGVVSVQCYEELREYSPGVSSPLTSIPVTIAPPESAAIPILATAGGTATQAVTDITGATVAAGETFEGTVAISAAAANAAGATATGTLQVKVTWAPGTGGTTANPVAVVDLDLPPSVAGALTGAFDSGNIVVPVSVFAGSTSGKFRCTVTSTGTISAMIWDVVVNGTAQ